MKKFEVAELEALELESTAFGPTNPNKADSEKYESIDPITGELKGWEKTYGEPGMSSTAQ